MKPEELTLNEKRFILDVLEEKYVNQDIDLDKFNMSELHSASNVYEKIKDSLISEMERQINVKNKWGIIFNVLPSKIQEFAYRHDLGQDELKKLITDNPDWTEFDKEYAEINVDFNDESIQIFIPLDDFYSEKHEEYKNNCTDPRWNVSPEIYEDWIDDYSADKSEIIEWCLGNLQKFES